MMATAASNVPKAISVRGPGARSAGRGVVTTAIPWPGRAGGGANGGTGSMAAAMLQGRGRFATPASPAGIPGSPSAAFVSAFIRS